MYRACAWNADYKQTELEEVLNSGDSQEQLVHATPPLNISLSRQDLQTLGPQERLNDQVINFVLNGLCRRSKQRMTIMSTQWYTRMCFTEVNGHRVDNAEPDCAGVRRWTNKLNNLLNYGYIVVPVNLPPGHWVLVVVNFARRLIQYFDSSGGGDGQPVDFNSISDNLPNVLALARSKTKTKKYAP